MVIIAGRRRRRKLETSRLAKKSEEQEETTTNCPTAIRVVVSCRHGRRHECCPTASNMNGVGSQRSCSAEGYSQKTGRRMDCTKGRVYHEMVWQRFRGANNSGQGEIGGGVLANWAATSCSGDIPIISRSNKTARALAVCSRRDANRVLTHGQISRRTGDVPPGLSASDLRRNLHDSALLLDPEHRRRWYLDQCRDSQGGRTPSPDQSSYHWHATGPITDMLPQGTIVAARGHWLRAHVKSRTN